MIIGVILNNFKCFKGMHYIPLTNADGTNFCGLIGLNGVGKSAVLEALDCVFNGKDIIRTEGIRTGHITYIIPICAVNEMELQRIKSNRINVREEILQFSKTLKQFVNDVIPATIKPKYVTILETMKTHWKTLSTSDIHLLPLNYSQKKYSLPLKYSENMELLNALGIYNKNIGIITEAYINSYSYIYIPINIAADNFAIFETEQILKLLGVDSAIKALVSIDNLYSVDSQFQKNIKKILHVKLKNYNFISTKYIPDYSKVEKELSNLIISHLLKAYKFGRTIDDNTNIPLSQASSGEKEQTIMDLVHNIVTHEPINNFIIAIDEPESSLHISERFEQFNKLYEISKNCGQVLFTSHWYGFIPSIPDGCVVNIVKNNDTHSSYILNTYNYREQIQFGKEKEKKDKIEFPVDVFLKGKNDLIQSIICSIVRNDYYNWLICEGSSDKIYLEGYFSNEIQNERLRIIPMGGCGDVYNLYEFLRLHIRDLKGEVKGKVFLLIDTDAKFHDFETSSNNDLRFKRVVNDEKTEDAVLVDNQNNPKQKTDIEDALNGKAFNAVLNQFKEEYPQLLDFVDDVEKDEKSSFYAMDLGLGSSKYKKLDTFFNEPKVKGRFARAYVEEIQKGGYKVPNWIEEIRKFFKS